MVIVGGRSAEEREETKTKTVMSTERSRSLHNFSLPCLKWGSQRHLRCVKGDADVRGGGGGEGSRSYRDFAGLSRKPPEGERRRRSFFDSDSFRRSELDGGGGGDGIEAVRKKLMLDLRTDLDRMKFAVLGEGNGEIPPPEAAEEARPWNLRTRRAVCKEPISGGGGGSCGVSPTRFPMDPPASRVGAGGGENGGNKRQRARPREKFSVALSRQEIEEDFVAMMGTRPPRRPKKRPRHVQKQMDMQFPGLWLSEITVDMYKVSENLEAGKR